MSVSTTTPAAGLNRRTTPIRAAAGRGIDLVESVARRIATHAVRFSLAIIMLWFGIPKFLPGGSPAEDIAVDTVTALSGGLIAGDAARVMVGGLEVLIGVALVIGRAMPLVILLVLGHMAATFAPLVLFPNLTWHGPGVGTLEGQYIIKNIVIIAGVIVLAAHGMRRQNTNTVPDTATITSTELAERTASGVGVATVG